VICLGKLRWIAVRQFRSVSRHRSVILFDADDVRLIIGEGDPRELYKDVLAHVNMIGRVADKVVLGTTLSCLAPLWQDRGVCATEQSSSGDGQNRGVVACPSVRKSSLSQALRASL